MIHHICPEYSKNKGKQETAKSKTYTQQSVFQISITAYFLYHHLIFFYIFKKEDTVLY